MSPPDVVAPGAGRRRVEAVLLGRPGHDLDDDAWRSIGGIKDAQGSFTTPPASNHPQYAMHTLLSRFGIKRRDVKILGNPHTAAARCWFPRQCGRRMPPPNGTTG